MRVDLENRCQSLQEELDFRKSIFEEVSRAGGDSRTGDMLGGTERVHCLSSAMDAFPKHLHPSPWNVSLATNQLGS